MAGAGPRAPRRAGAAAGPTSTARGGLGTARRALRFVPPLALMGLIWFLSSRHHLATDLGWVDTVLRKAAHMTEYGVLTLLWTRALLRRPVPPGRTSAGARDVPGRHAVVAGAVIALAWAVTDELHQSTVTGRVGTPWDVAIDAAGVGIAVLLWRAWTVLRRG
jgi:VanZ family protein